MYVKIIKSMELVIYVTLPSGSHYLGAGLLLNSALFIYERYQRRKRLFI